MKQIKQIGCVIKTNGKIYKFVGSTLSNAKEILNNKPKN